MHAPCMAVASLFSSRRRHTRCLSDWSSDVCSSDLLLIGGGAGQEWRNQIAGLVVRIQGVGVEHGGAARGATATFTAACSAATFAAAATTTGTAGASFTAACAAAYAATRTAALA